MIAPRCTEAPEGAAAAAAARHRAPLPRLETERLVLRAAEIGDLPLWTEIYTSEDAAQFGGPFDAETAWESFCVYTAGWLLHGHGVWAVERREDGALLGFVHLGLEWDDPEPELGWILAPEARGRGYATEAAGAARAYGAGLFESFVSCVDAGNAASAAVARRLGAAIDDAASAAHGVGIWRHRRPA